MVHDVEKIISHKIRIAEQVPIHWQKDRVWQNIQSKTETRRPAFFYYAAAIGLVACLTGYMLDKVATRESNLRIQSLEAAISNQLRSMQETRNVVAQQECDASIPPQSPVNRIQRPAALSKATATEEFQLEIPTLIEEPHVAVVVEDIKMPPDEGLPDQVQQPTIDAIIGFIPPQQEKMNAVKVKKMKFRFFDGDETRFPGGDNATILTARIN